MLLLGCRPWQLRESCLYVGYVSDAGQRVGGPGVGCAYTRRGARPVRCYSPHGAGVGSRLVFFFRRLPRPVSPSFSNARRIPRVLTINVRRRKRPRGHPRWRPTAASSPAASPRAHRPQRVSIPPTTAAVLVSVFYCFRRLPRAHYRPYRQGTVSPGGNSQIGVSLSQIG